MFVVRVTWELASGRTVAETIEAASAKALGKIIADVADDASCLIISVERQAPAPSAPSDGDGFRPGDIIFPDQAQSA